MNLIKLDAIDSTNSFLKELSTSSSVENFTIVLASQQQKGKGQRGASWVSESHKNLLASVFVRFEHLLVTKQRYLNFAVALAVYDTLKFFEIPNLAIKWPNDILSSHKKISGILVENVMNQSKISSAIIGVGLNVNQEEFLTLPMATSMKLIQGQSFDLMNVVAVFYDCIKEQIKQLEDNKFHLLEKRYLNLLYKYQQPAMFKDAKEQLFMGKIIGITNEGRLQVELENESVSIFDIKEISFV